MLKYFLIDISAYISPNLPLHNLARFFLLKSVVRLKGRVFDVTDAVIFLSLLCTILRKSCDRLYAFVLFKSSSRRYYLTDTKISALINTYIAYRDTVLKMNSSPPLLGGNATPAHKTIPLT